MENRHGILTDGNTDELYTYITGHRPEEPIDDSKKSPECILTEEEKGLAFSSPKETNK